MAVPRVESLKTQENIMWKAGKTRKDLFVLWMYKKVDRLPLFLYIQYMWKLFPYCHICKVYYGSEVHEFKFRKSLQIHLVHRTISSNENQGA